MTRSEVEEVVAHARALIEAHERRDWSHPFATPDEATAINGLVRTITVAFENESERQQVA